MFFRKKTRAAPPASDRFFDNINYYNDFTTHLSSAKALTLPAVLATARIIAEDTARVPLVLEQEKPNDLVLRKIEALRYFLNYKSSPHCLAISLRMAVASAMVTHGEAFVFVERSRGGEVRGLYFLHPENVSVQSNSNDHTHSYLIGNKGYSGTNILHIRSYSPKSGQALSAVKQMARSLDIAIEADKSIANVIRKAFKIGLLIEHNKDSHERWTEETRRAREQQLKESFQSGSGTATVLPPNLNVTNYVLPKDDMLLLQTRKFQLHMWAMVTRVPLYMLGETQNASYSNLAEMNSGYFKYTLSPYFTIIEHSLLNFFFTRQEILDSKVNIKHELHSLSKGDAQARVETMRSLLAHGVVTANEVRKEYGLPIIDGGNVLLTPANMVVEPVRKDTRALERGAGVGDYAGQRAAEAQKQSAALEKIITKIYESVKSDLQNKNMSTLKKFLSSNLMYEKESIMNFYKHFAEGIVPLARKEAEATLPSPAPENIERQSKWNNAYASYAIGRFANKGVSELSRYIDSDEDVFRKKTEELLSPKRAKFAAKNEITRANNAFSRATWAIAGVSTIISVARGGEDCPFCRGLNGKVIGIEKFFVQKGDAVSHGGQTMTSNKNRQHPPYHAGCDCSIVIGG